MTASYGHNVRQFGPDDFTISWVVDKHYSGSRLRFPRQQRRVTDRKGRYTAEVASYGNDPRDIPG